MSVGSIASGGVSIPFLAIQTPSGMIDDQIMAQAEELTTPGVNGRRWRTLFEQYPRFEMHTFTEVTDHAAGVALKRKAESLTQKNVRLNATIGTATYAYIDVHVSAVSAVVTSGTVAGAGASTGTAYLEIAWQVEMTTETAQ